MLRHFGMPRFQMGWSRGTMHYRVLMSYGVSEADAKGLWRHAIFYAKNGGMWHKQPAQWDAVPYSEQAHRRCKARMSFFILNSDLSAGVDPVKSLGVVCERASDNNLSYTVHLEGMQQAVLGVMHVPDSLYVREGQVGHDQSVDAGWGRAIPIMSSGAWRSFLESRRGGRVLDASTIFGVVQNLHDTKIVERGVNVMRPLFQVIMTKMHGGPLYTKTLILPASSYKSFMPRELAPGIRERDKVYAKSYIYEECGDSGGSSSEDPDDELLEDSYMELNETELKGMRVMPEEPRKDPCEGYQRVQWWEEQSVSVR
ncbi:hypothetical protein Agub_g15919, partial [Astrephomene gubernaculifera]